MIAYLLVVVYFRTQRRPHGSTLFPYTRSSDLPAQVELQSSIAQVASYRAAWDDVANAAEASADLAEREGLVRSEEHTSELQSQSNLVCRLLLEKKKHIK